MYEEVKRDDCWGGKGVDNKGKDVNKEEEEKEDIISLYWIGNKLWLSVKNIFYNSKFVKRKNEENIIGKNIELMQNKFQPIYIASVELRW